MEARERIDRVVAYIADQFAGGWSSVSKLDEIDDAGTLLGKEVDAVLRLARRNGIAVGKDNVVVDALSTMASTWGDGFENASADDFVNDDNDTVKDVILDHAFPDEPDEGEDSSEAQSSSFV